MNILKELRKLTSPPPKYKVGEIISSKGNVYHVRSAKGSIIKVTGSGDFYTGQTVLIEDDKIIAKISSFISRHEVP